MDAYPSPLGVGTWMYVIEVQRNEERRGLLFTVRAANLDGQRCVGFGDTFDEALANALRTAAAMN